MPLENFTTYTELDANDHITVAANLLDVNGITTSEDAWVYKDMGAGHFGATFSHDVKVTPRASDENSNCVVWADSNLIEGRKYWVDNGSQALTVFVNNTPGHGYRFYLENNEAPRTADYTADFFASVDTPYYLTIERTSDTSISCRIYSDAARTNLLDTLTVAITAGRTYRYIFAANSTNLGTGYAFSCDIENLHLHEPVTLAGSIDAVSSLTASLLIVGDVEITLDWTESDSADVADYPIYRGVNAPAKLDTPYATPAAPAWTDSVSGAVDALYTFLVRARDSDGNEEANILEMVRVGVAAGGVLTSLPAPPRIAIATAIADGKIQVDWLYDPLDEGDEPGVAHEARIYWDNGTGTIDWATPAVSVAMSHPTAADWYTWSSGVLVNEQEYLFCVRIGTDAWPAGIETQNTDTCAATADSDVPATPVLTATVV